METPIRFAENIGGGTWPPNDESRSQHLHGVERDKIPCRSVSAPPSMERSLSVLANFRGSHESSLHDRMLSTNNNEVHVLEEQLRSDPSYVTYYSSNINLNPRLPPLINHDNYYLMHKINHSWENEKLASFDEIERESCFMFTQASFPTHKERAEEDRSTLADSNFRFLPTEYSSSLEDQCKTIVDPISIQEKFPWIPSPLFNDQARLSSHVSGELVDSLDQGNTLANSSIITNKLPELGVLAINSIPNILTVKSIQNPDLSENSVLNMSPSETRNFLSLDVKQKEGLNMERKSSVTDVSGLNYHGNQHYPEQNIQQGSLYSWTQESATRFHDSQTNTLPQSYGTHFPSAVYRMPLYDGSSGYMESENPNFQQSSLFTSQHSMRDYAINASNITALFYGHHPPGTIPIAVENQINLNNNISGINVELGTYLHQLHKLSGQHGMSLQLAPTEYLCYPYYQLPFFYMFGASIQYYEPRINPSVEVCEFSPHLRSGINISSLVEGRFSSPNYYIFEVSDIVGHIAEYCTDQYGSRCIQLKVENCNENEKAQIFNEIIPCAFMLMTDVFGNYVIQKFFEHGNAEQRKVLANKLVGYILPLSLQLCGCRVIQKALEVIELDQKIQLVQELDTHVMQCVEDYNGNHVIQKCIECVPNENIQFILYSLKGRVGHLSLHQYGCRVIQRLLEHWTSKLQSQFIVHEILHSVCILAQDQYGNYVLQYVVERGEPEERHHIISELALQIVEMSQNKYASKVIEKCLVHADSLEKELLIEELIGHTEENEKLLIMMTDKYANYVIQKILETCSNKQRAILLGQVKVHLPALKNYSYGKYIVPQIERLYSEDIQ